MATPNQQAPRGPMSPFPSTLPASVRPPLALRWSGHATLPTVWPGRLDLPSGVVVRIGAAEPGR